MFPSLQKRVTKRTDKIFILTEAGGAIRRLRAQNAQLLRVQELVFSRLSPGEIEAKTKCLSRVCVRVRAFAASAACSASCYTSALPCMPCCAPFRSAINEEGRGHNTQVVDVYVYCRTRRGEDAAGAPRDRSARQ